MSAQQLLPQTYSYCAYGLIIRSNTAIPGLRRNTSELDEPAISIEITSHPPHWFVNSQAKDFSLRYTQPAENETAPDYTVKVWGEDRFFDLTYGDGARFVVDSSASRIWGQAPPLRIDEVAVYLRGPIMGFLLQRRGIVALHASTFSVKGEAILLCGPSESGKSTTAAALALRGVPILCDDITPLREIDCAFWAEPGYPRICLWPDVVERLLGSINALPRLTDSWDKRFLNLETGKTFVDKAQPVSAVYILADRESERAPRIETLSRREALLRLVQNTYMNWLLECEQRAREFDFLARLVTSVPVRKVIAHPHIQEIDSLCNSILDDAEQLSCHTISASI